MIRIAIVEDEDIYADQLSEFVKRYAMEKNTIIRAVRFHDGDEIVHCYSGDFDIILMDIQMRFMDGMSAAEEIRKVDRDVIIMFITNRVDYAIRGYEVDALDYIVKPVSYFSFERKLERAIGRIPTEKNNTITVLITNNNKYADINVNICFSESLDTVISLLSWKTFLNTIIFLGKNID